MKPRFPECIILGTRLPDQRAHSVELLCFFLLGPIPTLHLKQTQLNDQDVQHTFQAGKESCYVVQEARIVNVLICHNLISHSNGL
jgi:hypothetical protein